MEEDRGQTGTAAAAAQEGILKQKFYSIIAAGRGKEREGEEEDDQCGPTEDGAFPRGGGERERVRWSRSGMLHNWLAGLLLRTDRPTDRPRTAAWARLPSLTIHITFSTQRTAECIHN